MIQVDLDDVKTRLTDLTEATSRGEEVLITVEGERGKHILRVVSVTTERPRPRFGSAKGMITIHDDFDDPLPDFDEYQ